MIPEHKFLVNRTYWRILEGSFFKKIPWNRATYLIINCGKNSARGARDEEKRIVVTHPDQYRVDWGDSRAVTTLEA